MYGLTFSSFLLIPIQFCSNDPEVFTEAALLAEPYCDAVDLNLGCPQIIAKRGTNYLIYL